MEDLKWEEIAEEDTAEGHVFCMKWWRKELKSYELDRIRP
jgi:hypothetical protein